MSCPSPIWRPSAMPGSVFSRVIITPSRMPRPRTQNSSIRSRSNGDKLEEVTMTSVAAYDGARVLYKMIEATDGKRAPVKSLEAVIGLKWVSPRGPVSIDPETRHIRQNVYLREVSKQDGKLVNK